MNTAKSGDKARRNTQTRAKIRQALTELIVEKGFDALTVSDLTRRAGVNRGTFYLHFVDKFDALEQLEEELISNLREALVHPDVAREAQSAVDMFPYPLLLQALKIVAADFDFVAAISGKGGDPEFHSRLKSVINGLLDQGLELTHSQVRCDRFPHEYARELTISHVMSIITLWLERGGVETPEEVARMIVAAKDVCPCELVG